LDEPQPPSNKVKMKKKGTTFLIGFKY
jgi:hypothetical protein